MNSYVENGLDLNREAMRLRLNFMFSGQYWVATEFLALTPIIEVYRENIASKVNVIFSNRCVEIPLSVRFERFWDSPVNASMKKLTFIFIFLD